jgi:oligoendopeptidase F
MLYLQLKNKDDKIFLLQRQIEMMIGTFFRQVQFSEFEYEINLNFQKENFISPQKTAEIYGKIESKYLPFSKTKENFS